MNAVDLVGVRRDGRGNKAAVKYKYHQRGERRE